MQKCGYMVANTKCSFCEAMSRFWLVDGNRNYSGFDCEICGAYFISNEAILKLKSLNLNSAKLNCISENINSNASYGKEIITSWHLQSEKDYPSMATNVTKKIIENFLDLPIDHAEKTEKLLFLLANKAQKQSPFSHVKLSLRDLYKIKIEHLEEGFLWLKQLHDYGLIDSQSLRTMGYRFTNDQILMHEFQLTVKGWQQIKKINKNFETKNVFIAMQFDWGNEALNLIRNEYLNAVKSGCSDCGYEANIVSQNHTDYITDRIIADIKKAKFVVADFTFNNQGAYYEAGLARGLGKKVIHTVMKGHTSDPSDKFKRLHFDIKQINYIEWSEPCELRQLISDRINSTIEDS